MKKIFALVLAACPLASFAQPAKVPVLAGIEALERAGVRPIATDKSIGVGYALLSEKEEALVSKFMHDEGKCGGYEVLPSGGSVMNGLSAMSGENALAQLSKQVEKDRTYSRGQLQSLAAVEKKPEIVAAVSELKAENIREGVVWLSSFPSRHSKNTDPNHHVEEMEGKVRELMKSYRGKWTLEQLSHGSTRQKTLRLHLEGKSRPQEIVVLGGHLDSINTGWGGGGKAPGADDNASGSATLLEALRVLATKGPFERSVEFFWYAGEEVGLLGSADIARQYKAANKNVIGVLQLDMTMFPGSGELVIGNVDDFTSPWLREMLAGWNAHYVGARLIPDRCGYGCSDHASWYRNGYPTIMPFESDKSHMNRAIHTEGDVIGSDSSFTHALAFAKIAVSMVMDLGSSTASQGY